MRNTLYILFFGLTLAALPAQLQAQGEAPLPPREERASPDKHSHRSPVEMLLRRRAELELSDDQVVRLQAIDQRMDDRNRPHVEQLVAMRRALPVELRGSYRAMTDAQKSDFRERMKEARPIMEKIHENNLSAMREVGEILTADQKARVRTILHSKWGTRKDDGRHESGSRSGGRSN